MNTEVILFWFSSINRNLGNRAERTYVLLTMKDSRVLSRLKTLGWSTTLCRLHGKLSKCIFRKIGSFLLKLKHDPRWLDSWLVVDIKTLGVVFSSLARMREILMKKIVLSDDSTKRLFEVRIFKLKRMQAVQLVCIQCLYSR